MDGGGLKLKERKINYKIICINIRKDNKDERAR